jgi:hypothetical protein
MKFKILSILIISFLFIGCSQKINNYAKSTDILHEQSLTQTQKTVLKKGLITKMFFVTTYISQIEHNRIILDEKLEQFIVSAYVPSGEDKTKYGQLLFRINGKEPISVNELKKDDELLTILPAANPWSRYYIVKAPVDDSTRGVFFEAGVSNIGLTKMEFHDSYGNLPSGGTMGFKTNVSN